MLLHSSSGIIVFAHPKCAPKLIKAVEDGKLTVSAATRWQAKNLTVRTFGSFAGVYAELVERHRQVNEPDVELAS